MVGGEARLAPVSLLRALEAGLRLLQLALRPLRSAEQVVEARHRRRRGVLLEERPHVHLGLGPLALLQQDERARLEELGEGDVLRRRVVARLLRALHTVREARAGQQRLDVRQRADGVRVARVEAQRLLEELFGPQPGRRRVAHQLGARAPGAAAAGARPVDEVLHLFAHAHVARVVAVHEGGDRRRRGNLDRRRATAPKSAAVRHLLLRGVRTASGLPTPAKPVNATPRRRALADAKTVHQPTTRARSAATSVKSL